MISPSLIAPLLALAGLSAAAPSNHYAAADIAPVIQEAIGSTVFAPEAADCSKLPKGLDKADCEHMKKIGFFGVGANKQKQGDGSPLWIGGGGGSKYPFKFTNNAGKPVTLVVWDQPPGQYQSSFMNAVAPRVSYSLPRAGDSVTVSADEGTSGGWAALVDRKTALTKYGQVDNTWGEFTAAGDWSTADVSYEVQMKGNEMEVKANKNGCVSNRQKCSFQCKSGNTCGDKGSYKLVNCKPGSQPGANYGELDGQPEGGCSGWSSGGLSVSLKA